MSFRLPPEIAEKTHQAGACVMWDGPVSPSDYPRIYSDGERVLLRRYLAKAWGFEPKNYDVTSSCGNKRCVSPAHLHLRRRRARHPDAYKDSVGDRKALIRERNIWKNYGITLKEWDAIFRSQGNACAICGSADPKGKNWHTDHDHKTGVVRGILCGCCNTAIGKLQESPRLFERAAEYLKSSAT